MYCFVLSAYCGIVCRNYYLFNQKELVSEIEKDKFTISISLFGSSWYFIGQNNVFRDELQKYFANGKHRVLFLVNARNAGML